VIFKKRKAFHVNSGDIIFKSKHVGRHFCSDFQGVLEGSQRFCPDFMGICLDFYQIKTFGGAVAPLHRHVLHQCLNEFLDDCSSCWNSRCLKLLFRS